LFTAAEAREKVDERIKTFLIQCDEDSFVCSGLTIDKIDGDASNYLNHSCDPNTAFLCDHAMVALKDIEKGEQATCDYSTFDSTFHTFKCMCESDNCRGTLTTDDWKSADLQERYGDYFVPYLRARIAKLHAEEGKGKKEKGKKAASKKKGKGKRKADTEKKDDETKDKEETNDEPKEKKGKKSSKTDEAPKSSKTDEAPEKGSKKGKKKGAEPTRKSERAKKNS